MVQGEVVLARVSLFGYVKYSFGTFLNIIKVFHFIFTTLMTMLFVGVYNTNQCTSPEKNVGESFRQLQFQRSCLEKYSSFSKSLENGALPNLGMMGRCHVSRCPFVVAQF